MKGRRCRQTLLKQPETVRLELDRLFDVRTRKQIANALGVSDQVVYKRARKGTLPMPRLGRYYYVTESPMETR